MRTVAVAALAALTVVVAAPSPASATPTLRLHSVQYDSPGSDDRTNASRNAEWASLVNTGTRPVNLRGYTVRDRAGRVYTFGTVSIAANGGRIWLHTGSGTDTATHRYWRSGNYIWNNDGDTAYLRRPTGTTVDRCDWTYQRGRAQVAC